MASSVMKRGRYKKEDRVEILKPQGYYYAIYYVDGVRYVESTRSKNVVQAVQRLKELKFRRESGVVPFRRNQILRLPELIDDFLHWYETVKGRSPLSVRRHRIAAMPVLDFFGRISVRRITPALVERYSSPLMALRFPHDGFTHPIACFKINI